MENKEILEKAIQKAIDGGWNPIGRNLPGFFELTGVDVDHGPTQIVGIYHVDGHNVQHRQALILEEIIFNHDFAKALWGESTEYEIPTVAKGKHNWVKVAWQYHLQQMVIADDPIKYLGENM